MTILSSSSRKAKLLKKEKHLLKNSKDGPLLWRNSQEPSMTTETGTTLTKDKFQSDSKETPLMRPTTQLTNSLNNYLPLTLTNQLVRKE